LLEPALENAEVGLAKKVLKPYTNFPT
jgi:hypothetical protein